MKIGIIAIGVMVLIASTAVVMAKQGDSERLWIEGNKVMILYYSGLDYTYEIALTGPTYSEVNPTGEWINVYTDDIGRDVGTGNAKLFTVVFSEPGHDNPTGDAYYTYDNTVPGVNFALNDTFDATVRVMDGEDEIDTITGTIAIISETEE